LESELRTVTEIDDLVQIMDMSDAEDTSLSPRPEPFVGRDPEEASHRGVELVGDDRDDGRKAFYIDLEARPGKGEEVEALLADIRAGVEQEPDTGPWFALRYSETTFGVFEAFPHIAGRDAHVRGPGGDVFKDRDRLERILAHPARVYRLDVLFGKFDVMFGHRISGGPGPDGSENGRRALS
jgi:quinol monooxygenase YgiN